MLSKNKRCMIKSTIIGISLLILSFMLLFSFMYRFYQKSTEFVNEEACKDALVLIQVIAEKVTIKGVSEEYVKPWPAQCKTQDKVYYDKDPKAAERRLAELMSWCWYMMGEGVIKPFDKDWLSTERKCFICYTVSFPNLETDINKQDFAFYLADAKAKNGQKYYDYLKFSDEKVISTPLATSIKKGRIYSVVYTTPTNPTFTSISCVFMPPSGINIYGAIEEESLEGLAPGVSNIKCAAQLVKQLIELRKDDMVYIADINLDNGGCIGSYMLSKEVETGEGG